MKLKHLLFIISLVLSFKVYSGKDTVIIYTTYENYVNKIGETYDKMVNYYGTIKMKITVSKNAAETTVKCKEIWGFLYNGHLFRTDARTGQVGELIVKGKICYYENGIAHLEMIRNGTNHENFSLGYYCYVSKDLSSRLAPFPSPEYPISDANKQIKKFKRANPEYDDLFKAINKDYNYQNVRAKVMIFNRNFPDSKQHILRAKMPPFTYKIQYAENFSDEFFQKGTIDKDKGLEEFQLFPWGKEIDEYVRSSNDPTIPKIIFNSDDNIQLIIEAVNNKDFSMEYSNFSSQKYSDFYISNDFEKKNLAPEQIIEFFFDNALESHLKLFQIVKEAASPKEEKKPSKFVEFIFKSRHF